MNLASKILYTWLLCAIVLCLAAWLIDWDEHPRLANILATLIVAPIAIGLIASFVYLIIWIWF